MRKTISRPQKLELRPQRTSQVGIASCLLFGLGVLLLLATVFVSFMHHGQAGLLVGVFGFIILIVSVIGMCLGIWAWNRKGYTHTADRFGAVSCSILTIAVCLVFVTGVRQSTGEIRDLVGITQEDFEMETANPAPLAAEETQEAENAGD